MWVIKMESGSPWGSKANRRCAVGEAAEAFPSIVTQGIKALLNSEGGLSAKTATHCARRRTAGHFRSPPTIERLCLERPPRKRK